MMVIMNMKAFELSLVFFSIFFFLETCISIEECWLSWSVLKLGFFKDIASNCILKSWFCCSNSKTLCLRALFSILMLSFYSSRTFMQLFCLIRLLWADILFLIFCIKFFLSFLVRVFKLYLFSSFWMCWS